MPFGDLRGFLKYLESKGELVHIREEVDVKYEIIVQGKGSADVAFIKETHPVRYFFETEIVELLEGLGVEILAAEEWLTGKTPGLDTFGVCFVGRKR